MCVLFIATLEIMEQCKLCYWRVHLSPKGECCRIVFRIIFLNHHDLEVTPILKHCLAVGLLKGHESIPFCGM